MSEEKVDFNSLYGISSLQDSAPTAESKESSEEPKKAEASIGANSVKSQQVENAAITSHSSEQSWAEVGAERFIFTGVGFVGNEALSLFLTDEFQNRDPRKGLYLPIFNKGFYDKSAKWLSESSLTSGLFKDSLILVNGDKAAKLEAAFKASKPIELGFLRSSSVVNGEEIFRWAHLKSGTSSAKNMLMTSGLLMGGTFLVAPMLILADNKPGVARFIQHSMDTVKNGGDWIKEQLGFDTQKLSKEEIDARDKAMDARIATEPQQDAVSMLKGRGIAVVATMGFGYLMGAHRNKRIMAWSERNLIKAVGVVSPKKAQAIAATKFEDSYFRRYFNLAGIETVYCAIAAGIWELASKFVASEKAEACPPSLNDAMKNVTTVPIITPSFSAPEPLATPSSPEPKPHITSSASISGSFTNKSAAGNLPFAGNVVRSASLLEHATRDASAGASLHA